MSVINPDEWDPTRAYVINHPGTYQYAPSLVAVLCLLDLARYGTVQWFPDTDPADVPWAPEPEPEWVRCVDDDAGRAYFSITKGRVYRVIGRTDDGRLRVIGDDGTAHNFRARRFVPAAADEATVTIDVPVAWAQYRLCLGRLPLGASDTVDDACREALSKVGLL